MSQSYHIMPHILYLELLEMGCKAEMSPPDANEHYHPLLPVGPTDFGPVWVEISRSNKVSIFHSFGMNNEQGFIDILESAGYTVEAL